MRISENKIIQQLLPDFIESGIDDFTTVITKIIENKSKNELYRLAHSWKGSAAQYEFPEIAEKCKELIQCSETENWSQSALLGNEILGMILEIKELFYQKPKKKRYLL